MTRNLSATFVATLALLAACGEVPTSPLVELGAVPELTAPIPAPMAPAPAPQTVPSVVDVNEGFTLEDLEEFPELLDPYLDPVWLRATTACVVLDDRNPPAQCCPIADSTGRAVRGVSTGYNPLRDEVYTWGKAESIRAFPLLLLTDEEGAVLYVRWAIDYYQQRPYPYPSDVPMYFWPLGDLPDGVRYGVHMCPGRQVLARILEGFEDDSMRSVWAGRVGLIWEFKRRPPAPTLSEMPS